MRAAPSLDAPCLGCEGDGPPAHVILEFEQPFSLRWVMLHLIDETAHHAGHADSTREMLDGSKMRPRTRRASHSPKATHGGAPGQGDG